MPESLSMTPRKICIEDLELTTTATGATVSANVLGALGNPQTLNKIDMVRLTQFTVAANDVAAAAAGISTGQIYYNSTESGLHTRMT